MNNIADDNIPSYVVIGTTNVSIPLISNIGDSFGSIKHYISAAGKANIAFFFIGLISSAVVVVLSLVSIFLARLRILALLNLGFAILAPSALIVSALLTTIVVGFIVSAVNGVGSSLTISATEGKEAIALAWVAWALSVVSAAYWFMIWLVHFRRSTFIRRRRAEDEVGDWRATFRGIKTGLKGEKASFATNI
jgi:hypothetical protein